MRYANLHTIAQSKSFLATGGFVIGIGVTLFFTTLLGNPTASSHNEERALTARGHEFTNPLLSCADLPEAISVGARKSLEADVTRLIQKNVADGTINEASIYYRDLNNGPWFGINEEIKFDPASLFKLPLAISYFWLANEGSPILGDQIEYKGPPGVTEAFFPPKKTISPGTIYTTLQLIEYMLKESDNDATGILAQYMDLTERNQLFNDLGLEPLTSGTEYTVDTHTYASFFRILYNATYIGLSHSETLLKIMSDSSFSDGLVAGVPNYIKVTHKFGEHVSGAAGTQNYQLHDCGIVYVPGKPYTLCVMTRGKDIKKLPSFIASVSKLVYEETK